MIRDPQGIRIKQDKISSYQLRLTNNYCFIAPPTLQLKT